jgi:predicted alpha/beta hydrolase family esterase
LDYYRGLDQIHQDTVIVTHSSGCPFAAKYLVVNEIPVKGLVTVAGFNNYISGIEEFDQINSSFFLSDDDLRRVQHFVDIAHSFYSDNDPFLPLEQLESFSDSIGATPHLIEGGGHLNASAGFREFPELLNTLLTY